MTAACPDERARWLATQVLPHEPDLRAWLSRRLGAGLEVDDVVQETYAVLVELPDVDHIREPRAYFFTAARSVVLQHVRRSRIVAIETVAEIDRLGIEQDERSPDRHAVAGQELRRIGALVAALPARCREAFVLRKVQGLSQREIAARLGISENTVEKHVGKGLRLLMQSLAGDADAAAEGAAKAKAKGWKDHVQSRPDEH